MEELPCALKKGKGYKTCSEERMPRQVVKVLSVSRAIFQVSEGMGLEAFP